MTREMIEVRGVDGRLLAQISADGLTARIKRRNVLYEIDLVATWQRGAAVVSGTEQKPAQCVDKGVCAGVK